MTKTVLTCPQCGSSDLYYENGMITGVIYHCKSCDYIGPVVLERDMTDEELEAMSKDKGGRKKGF
jgi:late competence protein required for DNA uptake (superfamily II DNA/RNA helicase)